MTAPGWGVGVPDPLSERLMSVPTLPTQRRPENDGAEPGSSVAPRQPATQTAAALESAPPDVLFRAIDQLVRSQDRLARNRWAIDTHFRRLDAGTPFSRLEKIPNQAIWVAKLPPGASKESTAAVPNKSADLCNKVVDALLADPPKPNPMPHVTSEAADETGDLAAEFLRLDGGEMGTDDVAQYRWALRNALVSATSFLHYRVDPDGGGAQPLQVMAHPMAQDPADPLTAMVPQMDGTMAPAPSAEPVLRYVSPPTPEAPSGQFVPDAASADRVWTPAIRVDRVRREQVRLYPATATVEQADAAVLLLWCTLAEARTRWAEVAGMDEEALTALAGWRPPMAETLVPYTFRGGAADGQSGPTLADVGSLSPLLQRRMFYYRVYVRRSREVPDGAVIDLSGAHGGTVLHRDRLSYTVPAASGHGEEIRCLDLPLVQVTPQQDVEGADPMGWPFASRFAGSSEATATLYAAYLDALDQRLHPHVILRSTSPVDDDDWADRTKPIVLGPTDQPPVWEQFPPMPDVVTVVENLHTQQDVSSGLTATAQGLDSDNAVSGVAKQLTVRQAQVSLAGIQQVLTTAMSRGWRLKLQLAQRSFSTPQLLRYTGEDGSAQVRWFTGADLGTVDDVGIEPGTGTMMTSEAKANYVAFIQAQQWLPPDRAADIALTGIARDLGLPPDPAEQAAERAVSLWLKGPDPQWLQQVRMQAQQTEQLQAQWQQQAQIAQLHGVQPPPAPAAPQPIPPPNNPFPPRPNDAEPAVAQVWLKRLSKLCLSTQYDQQPPEWQAIVAQRYQAAALALQPPPAMPRGVTITAKGDQSSIPAEEAAAVQGMQRAAQPQAAPAQPQQAAA